MPASLNTEPIAPKSITVPIIEPAQGVSGAIVISGAFLYYKTVGGWAEVSGAVIV